MAAAQTTLSAAIASAGATSCTVRDALGFAASTDTDDLVLIDSEYLLVTAGMGTTTWTVTRGYAGSTAATHLDAAPVTRIERGWTNLTRVKTVLDVDSTVSDALLLGYIAAVNDELNERVGVFLGPSTDTLRLYDGRDAVCGGRRLRIPGGIRTLTAVRVAPSTGGTLATRTIGDFILGPAAHSARPGDAYAYIDIGGSVAAFPPGIQNVELTGTFGRAAVSAVNQQRAEMIVQRMLDARNSGATSNPTPSKFIYADDAAALRSLQGENFPMVR